MFAILGLLIYVAIGLAWLAFAMFRLVVWLIVVLISTASSAITRSPRRRVPQLTVPGLPGRPLAYRSAGRLDETIPLFERTLADRERILGDTHPGTLGSRNNLATAHQAAGRLDEARAPQSRTEPGSR